MATWGLWSVCVLCVGLASLLSCHAKTAEQWSSRIVYQVLTDRFGPTGSSPSTSCVDLNGYCNGTFKGIIQRLDYITGLGANAIWISPFVENIEGGWHGYWATDIYKVNPHMGSKQDLLDLISACHSRDVWVMMDVVANHMATPPGSLFNFTGYVPFNETWHYHRYCLIEDFGNQTELEICRLYGLPDLNQTVPFVRDRLLDWIQDITVEYGFDGYRVDTAVEVPKWFWAEFSVRAGAMTMGEANNGNYTRYVNQTCWAAAYQGLQAFPSVLNFPMYWALTRAFNAGPEERDMREITVSLDMQRRCFKDVSVLGLFLDNHDLPRFLNLTYDTTLLSNALTFIMFTQGFPIIYSGTEQAYHGGITPANRESLWPNYNTHSPLYTFIAQMSATRKSSGLDLASGDQREVFVDKQILIFTRGVNMELLVTVTNVGKGVDVSRIITDLPYTDGTVFVNTASASDRMVASRSSLTVQLQAGLPKVYRMVQPAQDTGTVLMEVEKI